MEIGKVPIEVLKEIIFSNIRHTRPEVLVRPNIGEDCAVVDFDEYVCVMSTDPITGAIKDIGSLAVHISCNDIASSGAEPLGVMLTVLAPPSTTKEDLDYVMAEANKAAASVNVEIIGGHTEITNSVNRMIISSMAMGKQFKNKLVLTEGAKIGDAVFMTKHAGLEGVSIIAGDLKEKLKDKVSDNTIKTAQGFAKNISVVKEGVLAGSIGVNSMHDVTEGGILGALWELAEASDVGIEIYEDNINIKRETVEICRTLSIDPMKLISSGVMVMTISENKKDLLIEAFDKEGIELTEIGKITDMERVVIKGGKRRQLSPPDVDELYKIMA
ncbi:MAG TPA: AIR synthase family protein [Oscillospiraceae bacterium]|nr:AIR synthase family protein [Oscillospiraceae bacterium]